MTTKALIRASQETKICIQEKGTVWAERKCSQICVSGFNKSNTVIHRFW